MDADTEQSLEEGFTLPLHHERGNLHLKALRLEAAKGKTGLRLPALHPGGRTTRGRPGVCSCAGAPAGFETLFCAQPKPAPFCVFDPEGTTYWWPPPAKRAASRPWSCLGPE